MQTAEAPIDGRAVQILEACSVRRSPDADIVTTAPSRWMGRIHNRMPVILQDNQIDTWLVPTVSDPGQLSQLTVLFWPDGRLIVSCGQRTDACPDGILSL